MSVVIKQKSKELTKFSTIGVNTFFLNGGGVFVSKAKKVLGM